MNIDSPGWSYTFLFAGMTIVLGIVGILIAGRHSNQLRSRGIVLQGFILALVAGAVWRLPGLDQRLTALLISAFLIIQHVWFTEETEPETSLSTNAPHGR